VPVIVSHKHQKLVVPNTPGAVSLFPDALKLPDGNLIIKHGIAETLLCRHLGYQVPNPFLLYYDWITGTKPPYAVQRATVALLTENPRAYVLNAMGTGKTKSALWAWDCLNKASMTKKVLVVAPLSTLKFVWRAEAFRTLPGRKVAIVHGSRQNRLDALAEDADIYVINHDGLRVVYDELMTRPDITCLIIDELAVYRNNSDRSKMMRKFAQHFQIVWGMTGAPMPNEPPDVWAQAKIVTPGTAPGSKRDAQMLLMTRISNYIWKPKPNAIDTAFRMLQPSVRYALDDVVELPPMIPRLIDVDMSPQQSKLYDKVKKELVAMVADKQITALNAGAAMNKLLQIAGGWVYTKAPEFVRLDASPRIATLVDLIESAEQKVIVFIPYRHMIEGIGDVFDRLTMKFDFCMVHGDTTNREQVFNLFQNTDKYKVMLAHPGCIHHGLTLTAADTCIWYMPITSLEVYDQANARIRRIGQQHKQQLLHLQATAVEKKIYALLRSKQKIQNQLLDMFEEATAKRGEL
jgi:SNF2 family DNA or RNA helicase